MYGLVNRAMKGLIEKEHGEACWEKICRLVGFEEAEFISMQHYPDEVTYNLVGTASQELNMPAEEFLEALGKYWILYTADEGYGEMLKASGNSLPEFLQNLDMLHTRVGNLMPKLNPPMFECFDITDNSLRLEYRSTRLGLTPMVIGLLKGLADRFGKKCVITVLELNEDNGTYASYKLEW